MNPDNFRTNVLTALGAIGYLTFFALAAARGLGLPVSLEALAMVFSAANGLLGVEFGVASLPVSINWQPDTAPDEDD